MVTAILPSLTDDSEGPPPSRAPKHRRAARTSAHSLESDVTITPERYSNASASASAHSTDGEHHEEGDNLGKPSALAGYVGLFTGCGALVTLSLFLPLPARFGEVDGVGTGDAVRYSFYVVALVALCVGGFVFIGLRGLRGEEGKGWGVLLGAKRGEVVEELTAESEEGEQAQVGLVSGKLCRRAGYMLLTPYSSASCRTSNSSKKLLD